MNSGQVKLCRIHQRRCCYYYSTSSRKSKVPIQLSSPLSSSSLSLPLPSCVITKPINCINRNHHISSLSQVIANNYHASKPFFIKNNDTNSIILLKYNLNYFSTTTRILASSSQQNNDSNNVTSNNNHHHHHETSISIQTKTLLSTPSDQFTSKLMHTAIELIHSWLHINSKEGIYQASKIFHRILDENIKGNPKSFIDIRILKNIITKWVTIDPSQCVNNVHDIVLKLDCIYDKQTFPYNVIIGALTKCHRVDAAKYSTLLLQKALDNSNYDFMVGNDIDRNSIGGGGGEFNNDKLKIDKRTKVDTLTFNFVLSCWMNIADQEISAGDEVMRILNRMKGSYRLGNKEMKPNKLSFSMTTMALLKSKGPLAALQAEEVLQDMIFFSKDGENQDKPAKDAFDNVLNALSKFNHQEEDTQRREENLTRALRLLEQMEELHLKPDSLTYNSIIAIILTTKGSKEAVNRIKSIIEIMKKKYSSGDNINAKVDTISYNSLIKACVNNNDEKMAERILRNMIAESDSGNKDVRPDIITWNSVLEAHAKSKSKDSVQNATRLLQEMTECNYLHPDKVTMSLMMIALTRSAHRGDKKAGKQAMLILDRMEAQNANGLEQLKPDTFTYTQIIHCIARSEDPECYAMAMDVFSRMKELRLAGRDDLKPDIATLNAVLLAIKNSNEGPEACERFLKSMEGSSDPAAAPNAISYSTVISAWSKSRDKNRAERAIQLLERMEQDSNVQPNTVAYSSVLDVLAKSDDPKAVQRSLKILQDMEKRYSTDRTVRPNAYTYSSVMESITNNPRKELIASQAENLLSKMIKMTSSLERDNTSYTIVFNNAIKAIEKSLEKNKAQKAKSILALMKTLDESGKLSVHPTVRTYNAIIRCCSFTTGSNGEKRQAFDIALDAFMEVRNDQSIKLDSYTYPTIFKACQMLLRKEETDYEAVKLLFYFCTQDGLVDGLILRNLKSYLPGKVLHSIVGYDRLDSLPKDWSRNAKNRIQGKKHTQVKMKQT